jgi:pimeloyl-ACP methyl ester carboxylesterase
MPKFLHGDVEIAFLDRGEGAPVVLVHGFASNKEVNWAYTGWVTELAGAGKRVIALDNRGHGESTKLYDPDAYHSATMAEDVRALLDHLQLPHADIIGYSLGARIAAFLALAHPGRVRRAVFGGLGIGLVDGIGDPERIARALEAPTLADISDPGGRMYRAFAEKTHSDLRALAACIRGVRQTITRDEVGRIAAPLLVAVGANDNIAGSPEALAALIPRAQAFTIPGRDHMLAVGDRRFKMAVLNFLAQDHAEGNSATERA